MRITIALTVAAVARALTVSLVAAFDEPAAFGNRHATERADLVSLQSIPLTSVTARQRATARKDARALDSFFRTPGLNY